MSRLNKQLRDLAIQRNFSPARRTNYDLVPMEDRAVSAGSSVKLFDDNPFMAAFDYVQYDEGNFKAYESLADPKVQKKPITQIKLVAAKSNPHMKAAMTDFQDYVVGGYGFKPNRTSVIDTLTDSMEENFGGMDSYFSDMTDSMFLYAAFFHGSIYTEEGNRLILKRFLSLDPLTAEFKRGNAKEGLGQDYLLGQSMNEFGLRWQPLYDDPNYFYRRLYSRPNYPYGVPFVDSGIFHMVMMVEFFKSYKSLLDSFVLPNLFFRVDREIVEKVVTDPVDRPGFVRSVFAQLMSQIKKLGPGRVVTMGSEVMEPEILSGMNEKTMGAAEGLINALDNQLELALKTHGLTTLRNDSALNDTKAKYRMANYSRVIKRAQNTGKQALNHQLNMAHRLAGSSERCELYFERNIYEDELILAEINSALSSSRKDGYDAMEKLMEVLDRAVEKGYMTAAQANQKFIDDMEAIEQQVVFSEPM